MNNPTTYSGYSILYLLHLLLHKWHEMQREFFPEWNVCVFQFPEAGFLFVYICFGRGTGVGNGSSREVNVYFLRPPEPAPSGEGGDDLKITHKSSLTIVHRAERDCVSDWRVVEAQADDYYPFGLTFNEYQREGEIDQRFLYQNKELEKDFDLNIYDFVARGYDPALGRTWQIDPHTESYFDISPYSWVANNPILNIDPSGMDWYEAVDDDGNVTSAFWREGSDDIDGYTNKGANYTMDLGDGVSVDFDQNEAVEMTENVLTTDDWESQMTKNSEGDIVKKSGDDGNCFKQSGKMVDASGAESLPGTHNNVEETGDGVKYIDAQIDQGKSIRVHVDRNGDDTGDHWVAISSRTTNLKTQTVKSYGFYDPGTYRSTAGTNSSNSFSLKSGIFSGKTFYSGKTYTLINVRKNKK